MNAYAAIAIGSALGGLCRYLCGIAVVQGLAWSPVFATAFVNVSGSFLIGLIFTLTLPDGRWRIRPASRLLILSGFLGGYTTFSILSLETLQLLQAGATAAALLNQAGSLSLALLAVYLGYALGTQLNRRGVLPTA